MTLDDLNQIKKQVFSADITFPQAIDILNSEIEKHPCLAALYLYKGEIYYRWGELESPPEKPQPFFDRALALSPNDEACLYHVGTFLRDVTGDYRQARKLLEKLVASYPTEEHFDELSTLAEYEKAFLETGS